VLLPELLRLYKQQALPQASCHCRAAHTLRYYNGTTEIGSVTGKNNSANYIDAGDRRDLGIWVDVLCSNTYPTLCEVPVTCTLIDSINNKVEAAACPWQCCHQADGFACLRA
jgi:hypothetical protein